MNFRKLFLLSFENHHSDSSIFIGLTFCSLAYEGTITKQLPVFLKVIVIVFSWSFHLDDFALCTCQVYSGENPLDIIKLWACLSDCSRTMSSAATLAVALQCAEKCKPLPEKIWSVRYPAVCKYSSVRFRSYRSILLHDSF